MGWQLNRRHKSSGGKTRSLPLVFNCLAKCTKNGTPLIKKLVENKDKHYIYIYII